MASLDLLPLFFSVSLRLCGLATLRGILHARLLIVVSVVSTEFPGTLSVAIGAGRAPASLREFSSARLHAGVLNCWPPAS